MNRCRVCGGAGLALVLLLPAAHAADSRWIASGGGDWANADNWDTIPNGATATALFGDAISDNPATVQIDTPVQLQRAVFDSAGTGAYTISAAAGQSLRMTGAANRIENRSKGGATFTAPLRIENSDLTIVPGADSDLYFNGGITEVGARKLLIDGAGSVHLSGANQHSGGTVIHRASVSAATNASLGAVRQPVKLEDAKLSLFAAANSNFASRPLVLAGDNNLITNSGPAPLTLESEISGASKLNLAGSSGIALRGTNTFRGDISYTSNVVQLAIDSDAALGHADNKLKFLGNQITIITENNLTTARPMEFQHVRNFGNNSVTFDTRGFDVQLDSELNLSQEDFRFEVRKTGTGQLTLTQSLAWDGTLRVNDGRLVIDGSVAPSDGTFVNGVLKGTGRLERKTFVHRAGKVAPGKSVGALANLGDVEFEGGSLFELEVSGADGIAGGPFGWDLLSVDGTLLLPTGLADPIVLQLVSLLPDGQTPGLLADFDPAESYSLPFLTTTGGIQSFVPGQFVVDTTGFANDPLAAGFRVEQLGASLALVYSPIPEPATWAGLLIGAVALAAWRRAPNRAAR